MFDPENLIARVPFDAFAAASCAVGKEPTRPYLDGVCIDGERGCLVATDGKRLVALRVAEHGGVVMGADRPVVVATPRDIAALSEKRTRLRARLSMHPMLALYRCGIAGYAMARRETLEGGDIASTVPPRMLRLNTVGEFPIGWPAALPKGPLAAFTGTISLPLAVSLMPAVNYLAGKPIGKRSNWSAVSMLTASGSDMAPVLLVPIGVRRCAGIAVVMPVRGHEAPAEFQYDLGALTALPAIGEADNARTD